MRNIPTFGEDNLPDSTISKIISNGQDRQLSYMTSIPTAGEIDNYEIKLAISGGILYLCTKDANDVIKKVALT